MITGQQLWDLLCSLDDYSQIKYHGGWDQLHGQWHRLLDRTAAAINEMEDIPEKQADPCATRNCGHSLGRDHKPLPGGKYGLCLVAACDCRQGLRDCVTGQKG